jgi:cytochrome c peroxidase
MSQAKTALGCRLFFDTRLSTTRSYSCASCHQPERAFTDGRALAVGATGDVVRRNAMSLTNVAYNIAFTWATDRIISLEDQMSQPLFSTHPLEMGLAQTADTPPPAIAQDGEYTAAFAGAFPGEARPVSMRNVIKAIAAFERTLISGRSGFDRYVFDDDRAALTEPARRGMGLFFSQRVGCVACHSGFNFAGPVAHERNTATQATFANTALYNVDGKGAYPATDTGLTEVTGRVQDMGRFRVPTLRNVELTAPYMHDGSIATLAEVVDHYARGGRQSPHGDGTNPYKDPAIRPIALSPGEKKDLVEFLRSLTDREFVNAQRYACKEGT